MSTLVRACCVVVACLRASSSSGPYNYPSMSQMGHWPSDVLGLHVKNAESVMLSTGACTAAATSESTEG